MFLSEALAGLMNTLQVSGIGILLGAGVGAGLGTVRAYRVPVLSWLATAFVELFRNTPFLAQLFLIYFGLPAIGLGMPVGVSSIVALACWTAAYTSENFRAGIEAVNPDFVHAGQALALSPRRVFLFISLPLAFRISLPALGNSVIEAVKNSAFLAFIGYPELTNVVINEISSTFRVLEGFAVLAVGYLGLLLLVSQAFRLAERWLKVEVTSA